MKITSINNGGNISFKSGYPTFQSSGHLTYNDGRASIYENTNPFYRQMTTNKGDNISFKGSPWNRGHNDTTSFKGMPPYRHHADEGKECPPEGCQPIKPQAKIPPEGGILIYRHVDMLGNVLDIKG